MRCINFFQKLDSNRSMEFDLKTYPSNSSKGCVLKVDLEYPKELRKLHNDCPLVPGKNRNQKRNILRQPIKDC